MLEENCLEKNMQGQLIVTVRSRSHNISLVTTPLLSSHTSTRYMLEENFLEENMQTQLIVTVRPGRDNMSFVTIPLLSSQTSKR